MSFLSVLAKVAPFAALAIPGVGPAVGGVLGGITKGIGAAAPLLGALGGVAGGAAQGSASQRIAETPGQIGAYRANLDATALGDKRAALASLLGGGLQDVQISRPEGSTVPTFGISGGLRPSAMNQSALLEQLSKKIDPLKMPEAGLGEKILGGIGLGGSILGALGQLGGQRPGGQFGTPPFVPGNVQMPMPAPPRRY